MEKSEIKQRIVRLQRIMQKKKIDVLFVSCITNKDPSLIYLISEEIDSGFLIVPKKGNSTLLASKMEYDRAKKFVKTSNVVRFQKPLAKQISKLIKKFRPKIIGINKNIVSVNEFIALKKQVGKKKYEDISAVLLELRGIKSKYEISLITKACKIGEETYAKMLANFKNFRTEEDIKSFMIKETEAIGCKTSFDPLVASGKNAGMAHYSGKKVKLGKGFCVIDFGVDYKSYKSDCTRTIYIGNPTIKELEIYSLLLDVQTAAEKMVKPGVKCRDLDNFVRKMLGKYAKNFTHNLGHGVGIEIHEHPSLYSGSNYALEEGMVLTIEPGIYFKNFGIRIEDTLLVTKTGNSQLTKTGKGLLIVRKP